MSTTISGDWETSNLDGGPYWALNGTWNTGGLVNGTDYTESLTMADATSPNNNTTITWSFPNTPAPGYVYSYPAVVYGDYGSMPAPANNVAAEQINNIKTLTLSQNVSLTGDPNQYDAMYDGFLTSTPDGALSTAQHELEVYVHTPDYVSRWIQNLPQQSFTDSNGMKWIIAENTGANPPMIIFAPASFQDLTNNTIDLKGLLQAAAADGMISGNEYFDGIALGNEPAQGSGSMTINSFSVNYDGDPNHTATPTTGTSSTTTTNPGSSQTATTGSSSDTGSTTTPDPGSSQTTTTGSSSDTGSTTTPDPGSSQTTTTGSSSDTGSTTTNDPGSSQTTTTGSSSDTGSTTTIDPGSSQTTTTGSSSDTGSTTTTGHHHHHQTAATGSSSGTSSATTTNSTPATGTTQDSSSNAHHHDGGASDGGGNSLHNDIVALLQALQQNNTNAVNNAMTTLGNDVHAASAADTGSAPSSTDHHAAHHFEHMWH